MHACIHTYIYISGGGGSPAAAVQPKTPATQSRAAPAKLCMPAPPLPLETHLGTPLPLETPPGTRKDALFARHNEALRRKNLESAAAILELERGAGGGGGCAMAPEKPPLCSPTPVALERRGGAGGGGGGGGGGGLCLSAPFALGKKNKIRKSQWPSIFTLSSHCILTFLICFLPRVCLCETRA
jgi:hypothetical protein